MNKRFEKLAQNNFLRSVIVVASGTAMAQAITMAFAPLITRIYGPEVFGVLGTFTAIVAILVPVSALSYPIAIVLPGDEKEAVSLVKLSVLLSCITASLFAFVLFFYSGWLLEVFNIEVVSNFVYLVPVAMLFGAFFSICSQWVIRNKKFRVKARSAVVHSLIINVMKSGLGLINPAAVVLVSIASISEMVHGLLLWLGVRQGKSINPENSQPSPGVLDSFLKYKDFAIFRAPQMLINSVSESLPVLLFASFFGASVVGFYALARTVLFVPSILIGQSVADVFYPRFTEEVRQNGDARRFLIKACVSLFLVGMVPYLVVILFGPWLFSFVFGESWFEAGEYARWMSLWLIAVLATRPIVSAISTLSLQKMFLIFECFALMARSSAIWLGYIVTDSAIGSVAAFSVANVVLYSIISVVVIYKSAYYRK